MSDEEYLRAIQEWRINMDANLRRENDVLALAGLFWLQKGFNTFGSSRDCDIILPKRAPHLIGAFEFDSIENIVLHIEMGQVGEINGNTIQSTAVLKTDQEDPPSLITINEFGLLVIQRADRFGVFVWDNLRPQRSDFPPRSWFPADEKNLVIAHYTPYVLPIKVELPNPFGELENEFMLGYVSFRYRDKALKLDATELSDGCLYLQFKDLTNGRQTYPSGRYLTTTEPVGEDGLVYLDFNRSYNPPSAFSDYAICNFASKKNRLNVAIEAGELYKLPQEKNTG